MKKHKKAIVLLNMGGPNSAMEIEMFLTNMFNDPLILPIKNNFFRKVVGAAITKARISASREIYSHLGDKSPINALTFALTEELGRLDDSYFYTYAMRYTPPFATPVILELMEKGIDELILFSMYPQYSKTTILSSLLDFVKAARALRYNPLVSIIESYPEHRAYLEISKELILEAMGGGGMQKKKGEKKGEKKQEG